MICSMIITILPSNFVIFLVFGLVVIFYNAVEIFKVFVAHQRHRDRNYFAS